MRRYLDIVPSRVIWPHTAGLSDKTIMKNKATVMTPPFHDVHVLAANGEAWHCYSLT